MQMMPSPGQFTDHIVFCIPKFHCYNSIINPWDESVMTNFTRPTKLSDRPAQC
jgi:hypothetical protein